MASAAPMAISAGTSIASTVAASTSSTLSMGIMAGGMILSTVAQILLAPEKDTSGNETEYATQEYTARSDNKALPRVYGTCRCNANMVWYGNYVYKDTVQSDAEKKDYTPER